MPASPPPLYVMRHGETDWNATGRYQGRSDRPLSERGRVQAGALGEALAVALAGDGMAPWDADFVSSPLGRCIETMNIVRRALRVEAGTVRIEPNFAEVSYGAWEGLTEVEIHTRDGAHYVARQADPEHIAPPGGESFGALRLRVASGLAGLERPTVIVCHAGVISALRALELGLDARVAKAERARHDVIYRFFTGRPA